MSEHDRTKARDALLGAVAALQSTDHPALGRLHEVILGLLGLLEQFGDLPSRLVMATGALSDADVEALAKSPGALIRVLPAPAPALRIGDRLAMVRAFTSTFDDWPPDNVVEVTMIETLVDGSKLITVRRPAGYVEGMRFRLPDGTVVQERSPIVDLTPDV